MSLKVPTKMYRSSLLENARRRFGDEAVEKFVGAFGGERLYIPKQVRTGSKIEEAVGPDFFRWLIQVAQNDRRFVVPVGAKIGSRSGIAVQARCTRFRHAKISRRQEELDRRARDLDRRSWIIFVDTVTLWDRGAVAVEHVASAWELTPKTPESLASPDLALFTEQEATRWLELIELAMRTKLPPHILLDPRPTGDLH